MTRQSTALMTVGPKTIAPWGDRLWRVSATAQLVEGSTPYWIVTPTHPAQHQVISPAVQVDVPYAEAVVESIVLLLAVHFGEEDVVQCLVETHNISVRDDVREIAPHFDISDPATFELLVRRLSGTLRLGFTILDEMSLVDETVVGALRGAGFDVDVFTNVLPVSTY